MKNPLLRPLLTEKSTRLSEQKGQYAFVVKQDADKNDIRKAVEEKFGVDVTSVRTANYLGKSKRQYTRKGLIAGRKSDWKKAIVTVGNGQVIDYYAGAGDKSENKD